MEDTARVAEDIVAKLELRLPSPLTELHDELLAARGIRLLLKREDLIHPELTGNKWRKLKYNLSQAIVEKQSLLLTFGGAYSNHIRAVAAAGHQLGLNTVDVIRGEEHLTLNDTLAAATHHGMRLTYLDRTRYRDKDSPVMLDRLRADFGEFYRIPEGGTNALGLRGCAELVDEITVDYDVMCCACGTGGTLAGVASALPPDRSAMGFAVLKGAGFLYADVSKFQLDAYSQDTDNWSIALDYHFGGYAKRNTVLDEFITAFAARHQVWLNWVYEAKMMYGLFDLISGGHFASGTTIVVVIAG